MAFLARAGRRRVMILLYAAAPISKLVAFPVADSYDIPTLSLPHPENLFESICVYVRVVDINKLDALLRFFPRHLCFVRLSRPSSLRAPVLTLVASS